MMKKNRMLNKKILVVDDEPEVQNMVSRYLARHGYQTCTASNGEEALSQVRATSPDLVLLDLQMPRMDGLGVCQKLREDPSTTQTPILIMTTRVATEDKVAGLGSGADDYLTKPFDLAELGARIESLLRRNQNTISANPLTHLPGSPSIVLALAVMALLAGNMRVGVSHS